MYNLKLFNEGLVDESIFDSMYIENVSVASKYLLDTQRQTGHEAQSSW